MPPTFERVLVGTDGSDPAARAVGVAAAIAAAADAPLDVAHVTPEGSAASEPDPQAVLESVPDRTATAPAGVEAHVLQGDPAECLVALVEDRDADLLVLGRRGRSGLSDRLLGSVVHDVLRRSERPVLTVPDGEGALDVSDVLVPTDGNDAAEWAVPAAAALSGCFDATVHVCHAVDLQTVAGPFSAGGLTEEELDVYEERGREAVEAVADRIRDEVPDVPVRTAVVRDRPHEGIRSYVEDNGVDAVAMSSRGQSSAVGRVLGTVADRVLRTVEVPVMVVTAEQE